MIKIVPVINYAKVSSDNAKDYIGYREVQLYNFRKGCSHSGVQHDLWNVYVWLKLEMFIIKYFMKNLKIFQGLLCFFC